MTIAKDGRITEYDDSFADGMAQWDHFSAFVDGANAVSDKSLWSSTNGRTFSIDNRTDGTRSRALDRSAVMGRHVLTTAVIAMLDSMPYWDKALDSAPFAPGSPLFGEPT